MKNLIVLYFTLAFGQFAVAEPVTFNSGQSQNMLIELYTSEGCSSCPPADEFLSQFTESDELWSSFIPIAFHVDYWDYLGWKDVFAAPEFTDRQRQHKKQSNLSSVYTPGFVINGQEWVGFFKPWRSLPEFDSSPGELTVTIENNHVTVAFPSAKSKLNYNLAIVGIGLITEVKSGENTGHNLPHDFVVLNLQTQKAEGNTTFKLPLIVKHNPKQFAVVAWVSQKNSLKPIQAIGGYLPEGIIKKI